MIIKINNCTLKYQYVPEGKSSVAIFWVSRIHTEIKEMRNKI